MWQISIASKTPSLSEMHQNRFVSGCGFGGVWGWEEGSQNKPNKLNIFILLVSS